ncbi:MazG-like family protein [Neobacillus pocheonensis]|uniref:MazG-like family protein n=1 Tax=Neobacillus pocheonensis TaxID=363869 RepID=A0ABT0WG10_9BACI|nr:MazG-like family protein [Neobacillus pocheonensis]
MREAQKYAGQLQKELNWEISNENYEKSRSSLLNNYMLLTTEVAEVAEEFRKAFNRTHALLEEGIDEHVAFQIAKDSIKEDLGKELADCFAYMFKIANFFELDMEVSFYSKMDEVRNRKNKDIRYTKK